MSGFLSAWIRGMAAAAVICGGAMALTPGGKVKGVLKVVCGTVMVIALISPLIKGDELWSAMDIAKYRQEAGEVAGDAEEKRTNLSRELIKRELETYVLDKAQSLGVELHEVDIILRWSEEGFWYPYEVSLNASSAFGKMGLESSIEGELGVPAERQYWSIGE